MPRIDIRSNRLPEISLDQKILQAKVDPARRYDQRKWNLNLHRPHNNPSCHLCVDPIRIQFLTEYFVTENPVCEVHVGAYFRSLHGEGSEQYKTFLEETEIEFQPDPGQKKKAMEKLAQYMQAVRLSFENETNELVKSLYVELGEVWAKSNSAEFTKGYLTGTAVANARNLEAKYHVQSSTYLSLFKSMIEMYVKDKARNYADFRNLYVHGYRQG